MCGRFTLRTPTAELARQFFELVPVTAWPPLKPRYNIAPSQMVAAIRWPLEHTQPEVSMLHWGLIPSWSKDKKMSARMINARGETVWEKPAFRRAFSRRRCLIPADGFYEWRVDGTRKLPIHISRTDHLTFCFAGLWESWSGPEETIESTTIITTGANAQMQSLHDRMPLILDTSEYIPWLRGPRLAGVADSLVTPEKGEVEWLKSLVTIRDAPQLQFHAANPIMNSARIDAPECLDFAE